MPDRTERRHKVDRNLTGESRGAFRRDRDRLLYSTAFRRLAGVTQVAQASEGFHNRLTHSLKVAQFGRRLAERLLEQQPSEVQAVGGIDPDVVETASLAHDLGHPPFGHVAEEELDELVRGVGVSEGYEGNAQSFRIVTQLAVRHQSHRGLNLTRATLNALMKYPWDRQASGKGRKKWGYYFSEKTDFLFVRPDRSEVRCPEASLMEWADDVTYAVHDVEDFYRAGVVPLDRLLRKGGSGDRDAYIAALANKECGNKRVTQPERAVKLLEELGDLAPPDVTRPYDGSSRQRAALNHFSAQLITKYSIAVKLQPDKAPDVVQIGGEELDEVEILQGLMHHFVFSGAALVGQQLGQRKVISTLFDELHKALEDNGHHRGLVPKPYREFLDADLEAAGDEADRIRIRARLAADIVASLTEQQAISLYQRLIGIETGSVLDTIMR